MIETRPVNQQLIESLQVDLGKGRWQAGERFPTERELADTHGISRVTANKVISKLVSEGWLEIRRGLGTFVARRSTFFSALRQMESFTAFGESLGLEPSTEVLSFETLAQTPDHLCMELGIAPGGPVIELRRLRCLKGMPVISEERWLPKSRYPRLQARDVEGSFYRLCQKRYNLEVAREDMCLVATLAPKILSPQRTATALCLEGISADASGRPLWKQRLHYRGDCFQITHETEHHAAFPQLSFQLQPAFLEGLFMKGVLSR